MEITGQRKNPLRRGAVISAVSSASHLRRGEEFKGTNELPSAQEEADLCHHEAEAP